MIEHDVDREVEALIAAIRRRGATVTTGRRPTISGSFVRVKRLVEAAGEFFDTGRLPQWIESLLV